MPRRRGLGLSALLLPAALLSPALAAPVSAAKTALAPHAAAEPIHTFLARLAPQPMGSNTGVRLWVHGDGHGASLRVRLMAAPAGADQPDLAAVRPAWVSPPIALALAGWHAVVLPQSKFTPIASGAAAPMDPLLPADAQAGTAGSAAAPDWSTINAIALETSAARPSTVLVDDIAWATLDDAGVPKETTVVADFEKGDVGAWKVGGTRAQREALSYALTTRPVQVHGGTVAFSLSVAPPSARHQALLVGARRVMALTHQPYLVWTPASLFETILPTSLPAPGSAGAGIAMTVCPDQIQAASFCLYSPRPLSNVSVAPAGDLQGIGRTLRASAIDVRVVKVWKQAGSGPLRDPDLTDSVPELLVKDDRVPLTGSNPVARLTGAPVTSIPADTARQFWVTVSVPRGQGPGQYTGRLLVSGVAPTPVSVRLAITVLPLRLLSPAKQYGIDLRSRLDPAPAALPASDGSALVTDFVSRAELDKQLQDIVAHGFTIASLYDSPATLWDAIGDYKVFGLGTSYNVYKGAGDPKDIEAERAKQNAPPMFYYAAPMPLSDAQIGADKIAKSNLQATTYIARQADEDKLDASLELPVYNRDAEYPQQLLRTHGKRTSMKRDWWYWPATNEDPVTNRLGCGFLLWRANLYGAYLPDYQTAFGTDPYDETSAGAPAALAAFRPEMLTYPVQDGVLDTLQWEAAREGVNDTRYLTTMYAALRECKDAHIAKPLVDEAEAYVKGFEDKALVLLPDTEFDRTRAKVADYALKLRTAVDAYNKAHHLQ